MKIILFILMNMQNICSAGVLLIPSSEIKFEPYLARCLSSEFLCTNDYFISLLKNHKTPEFDKLMDSVDLDSAIFKYEFQNRFIHILNSEDLNQTQLHMLTRLLGQINTLQPSFLFKSVADELNRLQSVIDNSALSGAKISKKEFIFIFKEMLSMEDSRKIRTTFLKIPLYILHFSSKPIKTDSFALNRGVKKPLLAGFCGTSTLTYKVKSVKLCNSEISNNSDNKTPVKTKPDIFIKERNY